VVVGLGLLLLAEYASKPLELATVRTSAPETYADIERDRGDGPTATLFEFPPLLFHDPTYLYYSTFHWQNLVNGYSGFFPPSYVKLVKAMRTFPDETAMNMIRSHGARYVVIHGEWLPRGRDERLLAMLDARPDFALISRHPWKREFRNGEISVYRIEQ